MALQTKTITAKGSKGHHKFTLTVTENSVSDTSGLSTMGHSLKLSPIQTGWDWSSYSKIAYSYTIGSKTFSGYITSYDGESTVTLNSGTFTIEHDADGTKEISISLTITDPYSVDYTPGSASASGQMTLTAIKAQKQGLATINNGSGLAPYQSFISNGTSLAPYQAFISNGTSLEMCD